MGAPSWQGTEARTIDGGKRLASIAFTMRRTRVIHVDDMVNHPDAIYIGRAVPQKCLVQSTWYTPYAIGPDGDRVTVIAKYRKRMQQRMVTGPASTTADTCERSPASPWPAGAATMARNALTTMPVTVMSWSR